MVPVLALWLPILRAAVIVFVVSSLLHMVLPFRKSDYGKLQNEGAVIEAMRKAGVSPGDYQQVEHHDQERDRRLDLRPAHGRHVRLAVAELTRPQTVTAGCPPGLKPRGSIFTQRRFSEPTGEELQRSGHFLTNSRTNAAQYSPAMGWNSVPRKSESEMMRMATKGVLKPVAVPAA